MTYMYSSELRLARNLLEAAATEQCLYLEPKNTEEEARQQTQISLLQRSS